MTHAERVEAVLELLRSEPRTWTAREVACRLDLHKRAAQTALADLRVRGLVDHVAAPEGAHYPIAGWALIAGGLR